MLVEESLDKSNRTATEAWNTAKLRAAQAMWQADSVLVYGKDHPMPWDGVTPELKANYIRRADAAMRSLNWRPIKPLRKQAKP